MPAWLSNRRFFSWLILLGSVVWVVMLYLSNYPVRAGAKSIEQALAHKWKAEEPVSVLRVDPGSGAIDFGDKSVLYHVTLDGKTYLGFAKLKRGLLGRYRFTRIASSSSSHFYVNHELLAGQEGFLVLGINPGASRLLIRTAENIISAKALWSDNTFGSCFIPSQHTELSITLLGEDGRDLTSIMEERHPDLQPQRTVCLGTGMETPLYKYCLILIAGAVLALCAKA